MLARPLLRTVLFAFQPFPPVADWTITRLAGNPVITIPAGESLEQYTPAPILLPNGDIWIYVKGNSRIYAWKSTDDGVTFTLENGGTAVLAPVPGGWELGFVVDPGATYDEATDTIHLYYKGRDANPINWQWGHATAPGTTPTVFTRDPANPILTKANAQADLGGATVDLSLSQVIKIGSTFHFYGYVELDGLYYLCQATGTAWNDPSGLNVIPRWGASYIFEAPSVIRAPNGTYLMLYAKGDAQPGPRSVLAATSPDGETWSDTGDVVLAPNGSGWEELEAYSGQFLRKGTAPYCDAHRDGSGRLMYYYSGLSAGGIARVGLAYIDV